MSGRKAIGAAVLTLLAAAATGTAWTETAVADLPSGDDIIGIYTAADGSGDIIFEGSGGQATLYIVISGVTGSGVAGWETNVDTRGSGAVFLSAHLLGEGPLNLFSAPVFQVGLGVPMTSPGPGNSYAVASLDYFVASDDPTLLYLDAIPNTSWPEDPGPGYADALDVNTLIRCLPSSGDQDVPVFGFNASVSEEQTWGAVKGLFDR